MRCKLNRLIAEETGPSFALLNYAKNVLVSRTFHRRKNNHERLERLVGTPWRILSRGNLRITRQLLLVNPARLAFYCVSWRLSRGISARCRAGSMWVSRLIKSCRRQGKKRGTTRDSDEDKRRRGVRGPERGRREHKERRRECRIRCPFSNVQRLATAFEITFVSLFFP